MYPRFFSGTQISDTIVRLSGDEAHHMARVRRVRPGDMVTLWDGTGTECEAQVAEVSRHDITLRILRRSQVDRESPVLLTIAVALPKGNRQHFLIEKCVELGVHAVIPIETSFSVRGLQRPCAGPLPPVRAGSVETVWS